MKSIPPHINNWNGFCIIHKTNEFPGNTNIRDIIFFPPRHLSPNSWDWDTRGDTGRIAIPKQNKSVSVSPSEPRESFILEVSMRLESEWAYPPSKDNLPQAPRRWILFYSPKRPEWWDCIRVKTICNKPNKDSHSVQLSSNIPQLALVKPREHSSRPLVGGFHEENVKFRKDRS